MHGLINNTDRIFLKIDLRANFSALIRHPSRRKCTQLKAGGLGWHKTCAIHRNWHKKSLMVKDHYQLIMCMSSMYIISRREHATPESSQVSRGYRNLSGYVSSEGSWRDVAGCLGTFQLPYVLNIVVKAMSMDMDVPFQRTNFAKCTQNILPLALYGNIYFCIFSPIFVQKV